MAFIKANKTTYDNKTWEKEKNPVIEGTYVEHKISVMGKIGSDIYVIENETGKWAVWSSKVLDDFFGEIETGSVVQIKFLGKKKTKNGINTFNDYEVAVDDGTGTDVEPAKKNKDEKGELPF